MNFKIKNINQFILVLVFQFLGLAGFSQTFVELQDLQIALGQQVYSAPVKNKAVTGENISIAGVKYSKGIGVHASSNIRIKLNNSRHFSAIIGVNDNGIDYSKNSIKEIPLTDGTRMFYDVSDSYNQFIGVEGEDGIVDQGSVVFRLVHNGKEIYNSGTMRRGDAAKKVDVKIGGGILELIVDDANDGVSGDHAVWVNPKIEYFEIAPVMAEIDYQGEVETLSKEVNKHLQKKLAELPKIELPLEEPGYDWLIDNKKAKAQVYRTFNNKEIILSNGLVARVFRLIPNLATVDYVNQMTGESMLRAVSNEGIVLIDGKKYTIGGLSKQPEYGYTFRKWIDDLSILPNSFIIEDFEVKSISDRMEWKQVRWAANKEMPKGKEIVFKLSKNGIVAKVHVALYDGLPTFTKWIEFENQSDMVVQLNSFTLEQLAMVEAENLVDVPEHWEKPNIHIETDYAFGAMQQKTSNRTTHWVPDPRYTTQTNYPLQLECMLEVRPPHGPETAIPVGQSLSTFRVWETPIDSHDKERRGMFIRKFYRTISPWTTENPIFLHLTSTDPDIIKRAVDQCAEVGYEMIILSFGSGLNMENESEANLAKFKKLREYANSKGIELGGYSLLSSRWISDEVDVINPKTGKRGGMIFGSSPCLCSEWGFDYFRKVKKFFTETGMQVFEHDGSYPGNVCASTKHAHHNGLGDSQWKQYAKIQSLYKWMRSEGIYMNVPDFYVNSGTNKTGIGYREVNWSLPRERQLIHGRLNIYDGLWDRIPSMCWTFVPLTQYHGGGAAATLEPLKDHLKDYEHHMMQNYGAGVQACYRGPRLYDAPETKDLVKKVIDWYKQYRDILNSDLIHLRRASGKDWDGFLHVNPQLKEKGLAMFFNPTDKVIEREITLPLYYTGLTDKASIRAKEGKAVQYKLNRDYSVKMKITIPANSFNWYVIE
jgi:hypothetical protein